MSETVSEVGETRTLASFCAETGYEDLDEEVKTACRHALADTIAACYAGTVTDPGRTILQYVETFAGSGEASVIGRDVRTLPHFAALANGTTAHALDVDDGHRVASAHPGSAVIPAALATLESNGGSGTDLITAIAVGYEAMITTAVAVQTSHRERGFHATATCGCFGAAAATASILGLDADETANALGLAGTQAGGLFEFLTEGSDVKRFHPGRAALAGVLAGELAMTGFDGPDTIIEGPDGFARGFTDEYDLGGFETLGDPFEVTRAYIKPYPACRHIHGPIDLARSFREELPIDEIERVTVETYRSASHHDKTDVRNVLDAQMSLPYGFAVAYRTGEAGLDQFVPPRTDDEQVTALMNRITVEETAEMEASYPDTRPARVTIETTSGETVSERIDYPRGAAENPITEDALRGKFADLTDGIRSSDEADELFDATLTIETVASIDEFTERL